MKRIHFFFALLLSISFFTACEKGTVSPEPVVPEETPTIPPLESFVMPFSNFADLDTSGVAGAADTRDSYQNWFYAGTNILVWNTVLTINMVVPIATFRESFNHNPVFVGNGTWEWAYDTNVNGVIHKAALRGKFINAGQDVNWTMTVSKVGGFSNMEFYSGVVAADGSKASWTLNHRPNNPEPLIAIDYEKDPTTNDEWIRYTNIVPNNPDNGDYIEYRTHSDLTFNRAYDVFLSENNFLQIEWDEPAGDGRVKNHFKFGDDEWHCWDADQMDMDCE